MFRYRSVSTQKKYTLQPYFNAIVTRVSPLCSGASANVTNDRRRRSPSDDLLHCLTSWTSSLHSSSLERSFPKIYVRASAQFDVKLLSYSEESARSLFWGMRVLRTRWHLTGWHIVPSMQTEIMWLYITCPPTAFYYYFEHCLVCLHVSHFLA